MAGDTLFGFLKKKKENNVPLLQEEITTNKVQEQSKNDFAFSKDDFMHDVLTPKTQKQKQEFSLPESTQTSLDFETIEIKTRPSTQTGYQLSTFSDLSMLAKRTPIFVYRSKAANIYFGIVEGKMFYLKK